MDWITLQGVGKKFKSFDHPGDRVKELLTLGRRRYHKEYWALRDVSLSIRQGETFCIVGENGSGKTTLLKLIAGILQPTTGSIAVKGRLSALLELGSGFSPEFTGRENVFLNGAILGFSNKEIQERLDEIFAFAEIGEAVDQPLKTYSSGMVVRLAFAVAVQMDPDILVVDEALSVGDVYFSQRCMRKIHALRDRGVTVIFVSHNIGDVKALGDRTLWLERGRVVELGKTRDVAQRYMAALVKKDAAYLKHESLSPRGTEDPAPEPPEVVADLPAQPNRHGDRRAQVLGIRVTDEQGAKLSEVEAGKPIVARISVHAAELIRLPIVGIQIRDSGGVDLSGTNTSREGVPLPALSPGDELTVDFHLRLPEIAGHELTFTPAVAEGAVSEFALCDMVEDAVRLPLVPPARPVRGLLSIPCRGVRFSHTSEDDPATGTASGVTPPKSPRFPKSRKSPGTR